MVLEIKSLIEAYAKNMRDDLPTWRVTEAILSSITLSKYTVQKERGKVTVLDSDSSECVYTIEDVWRTKQGWAEDILITIQNDDTIQTHSLSLRKVLHSAGPFESISINPFRDRAVAINSSGEAVLIDLRSGEICGTFTSDRGASSRVWYGANGEYVIAVTWMSGFILNSENLDYVRRVDYKEHISSMDVSPDKRFAFVNHELCNIEYGGRKPVKIVISDEAKVAEKNREVKEYPYDEWDFIVSHYEKSITFSPDSKYMVAVSEVSMIESNRDGRYYDGKDSKIIVFDAKRLKEICILDTESASFKPVCREVAFSPDGQYVVDAQSKKIMLWKNGTWELCAELLIENNGTGFSQDGKYLLIDP
ncbi:MAG: hypothetical protein IJG07_10515 [Prevotella sp.]|nr:hypothetical protein [Prevotella sp.]